MGKFELIVFVIFGVMALVRAVKNKPQNRPDGRQVAAEAPARRRKVQSDIDAFLSEVGVEDSSVAKSRSKQAPGGSRRQQPAGQRRQTMRRKRQKSQPLKTLQQQTPAKRQPKTLPAEDRARGSSISSHIDTYISQHVTEHVNHGVADAVEADIVESVESHLGNRAAELPTLTHSGDRESTRADTFRQLLKSRKGVRQAILLNEVLSRPRVLRR